MFVGKLSAAASRATQYNAHLELELPEEHELLQDVKRRISLGRGDHDIVVFQVPMDVAKESSRAQTLHIRA